MACANPVDDGNSVASEDFDASEGHARCFKEAKPGRLILHGNCAVHADRLIGTCKVGWMSYKDDATKVIHTISKETGREMKALFVTF